MIVAAGDKKLEAARENHKLTRPTPTRLCSLIPKANKVFTLDKAIARKIA
jgi:hypothetical protein